MKNRMQPKIYNVYWVMLCSGGGIITGEEREVVAESRHGAAISVMEMFMDEFAEVYDDGGRIDNYGDTILYVRIGNIWKMVGVYKVEIEGVSSESKYTEQSKDDRKNKKISA